MKLFFALVVLSLGFSSHAQNFIELNEAFVALYQKGEYQKAIPVGEKAIAQAKKEFGEKNLNYAIANQNLAEAYYALDLGEGALPYYKTAITAFGLFEKTNGIDIALCNNSAGTIYFSQKNFDSAAYHYEKALPFFIKNWQENYDNLVVLMNNFSELYLPIGKNKEAQAVYKKILPIIKQKEGTKNPNYYITLTNLAAANYGLQLFADAENNFKEVALIIEELKGASTEYADVLDQLATIIREQGRVKEAESIILKAYEIKKTLPTFDTLSIVSSYNALANIYNDLAEFSKAENYFHQALLLLDKNKEAHSEWYQTTLRNFGYSNIESGKLAEAKTRLSEVLQLQKAVHGDEYPENGIVLITIANAELQLNQLTSAEQHANEGLTLITNIYGAEHYAVAKGLETLGLVFHKTGRSTEGINYYKKAAEINTKIFGKDSRHLSYTYSNLGIIYQDIGKYAQAELVLSESYRIREKIFGPDHPDCALSLANLGMVYMAQARFKDADKLLADAVSIYTRKGLTHTNNFLNIVNNIALMSDQQGNYEESKKLYFYILKTINEQEDKNHATLFVVLNNLSQINIHEKKYDSAIAYAGQAVELARKYFGVNTMDYIKSMNNLMAAQLEKGNLEQAQESFSELLPLCQNLMGPKAPLLGRIYLNGCVLALKRNDLSLARKYIDSSNLLLYLLVEQNFLILSEKEKLAWWQDFTFHFDLAASILLKEPDNPGFLQNFANDQLTLKGFVLNDAAQALKRARQNGNKQLKDLIEKWETTRAVLSKEQSLPGEQRTYSTDSLETIANALEKNINTLSSETIKTKTAVTNWKNIHSALLKDEAAIEFIRFNVFEKADTVMYAALLFLKEKNLPVFIPLCSEAQLAYCLKGGKKDEKEINISRLYRSSINSSKNDGKFLGDSLYQLIWQPLLPYLQNINSISFAPDGLLHKVAFHALPTPDKKLLIDNYQLQQYSSIRQLVNRNEKPAELNSSVFLLGNADFNTTSITSKPAVVTTSAARQNSWNLLPGTKEEVNNLKQVFTKAGMQVSAKTEMDASEESFKKLDGHSPAITHLATHGFFLAESKNDSTTNSKFNNAFTISPDPLVRSGLVLAGGNNAWNGKQPAGDKEDGILTAFEIAQMDLHSTQLVVLSACETALGDLQGSEGVFGLQRAFKIAGVKNLIVSLWQVPDKETVELMTAFYTKFLAGKPVREAFYLAQKEMRSKYTPFFWAAFVLVE